MSPQAIEVELQAKCDAIRAALLPLPAAIARETVASTRLSEHEAIMQRHFDDALELLSSEDFYERLAERERTLTITRSRILNRAT